MIDKDTPVSVGFVDRHFQGAGSRAARLAWGRATRPGEPDFLPTDQLRVKHFEELAGVQSSKLIQLLQRAELLRLAGGGR